MKTIGELIRQKRKKKKLTIPQLSKETKIKREFIQSIEKMNWDSLPEYPVVQGFIKSLSTPLGIDREQAVAVLRRDYPPKRLPVNPKPDVAEKFSLTPKLVFIAATVLATVTILGYLVIQYITFRTPPELEITSPAENQEITESTVLVEGITDEDATLKINDQPVIVGDDGSFSEEIEISEETSEMVVVSTSRAGKETTVRRTIINRLGEEEIDS